MRILIHFQIFLSIFFLCTFGSLLARNRLNPNYSARIGQATNGLTLEGKKIQNNWGFQTFHNKNFVRNFCAKIEPEKLYLMSLLGDSAEAELNARNLAETDILSRWHYQILYKDQDSGEEISILAIPRVEIRKAARGSSPHYFSDLEIANAIVEAVSKVKSDPKLQEFAFDWIVVKEVIYNDATYENQFIKQWKSAKPEPDWETIEDLIKKSKFGKFWRSGPDALVDNLPDSKEDF
jgi:hypothetical protein